MSIEDANKYFSRNLDIFSDPDIHPEKYNFYMGMVALTDALTSLQGENRKLKLQVVTLQKKVSRIKPDS